MPKVKQHKARTDIYNKGIKIPDEKTKSGFRSDHSQPADENDTIFVKKGETYYSWGMMMGGRGVHRKSKTYPTRSQLTNSDFLGQIYDLEDNLNFGGASDADELSGMRDEIVSSLRDLGEEQRGKYDNMPDGLQQGDTGQLLEARAEACETIADEFDDVDLDYSEPDEDEVLQKLREDKPEFRDTPDEDIPIDDVEEVKQEMMDEWLEEKVIELGDVGWDYE